MKQLLSMLVVATLSLFVSTSAFAIGNDDDNEPQLKVYLTAGGVDTYLMSEVDHVTFTPEVDNHEFVNLGLPSGTLWATMNVGANRPEECGDYFAWGETEPHANNLYTEQDYSFNLEKDGYRIEFLTKYCNHPSFGYVDNKSVLEPCDDAATVNWGSSWRMPTKEEYDELYAQCTFYGYYDPETKLTCDKVVGPNGNYIILPRAGYYSIYGYDYPMDVDSIYYYWTSTVCGSSHDAYYFSNCVSGTAHQSRAFGLTVRPVRNPIIVN